MVDYSKWKDIEISDDEDETHPNIDTPSLFRWRHQARVERMEELQKEKETFESRKLTNATRLKEAKAKQTKIVESSNTEDKVKLDKELSELEKEAEKLRIEEEGLKKKEKKTPWNVDTISKPGFAKTVINKPAPRPNYDSLSEEEKDRLMKEFVKKNEKALKQYGLLKKYEDSKRFLQEHHDLVCENTANYLVIWCINLEMEEKHELMCHVAHQCISMQYILELSKQLDVDPRSCVASFFTRIQVAEVEYKKQFDSEVAAFIERIKRRAQEKIDEAIAEQDEEERKARLGPGGLDPVEVFETLPDVLKQCFESRDISLLQNAITQLPEDEAKYHMKRCVDSGLWIPDANKKNDGDGEPEDDGTKEPIYEESTASKGKQQLSSKPDDLDLD